MAEISAQMVKELRQSTGLGVLECKKALVEAKGDSAAAMELLRARGGARAAKMAQRQTREGAVAAAISQDGARGALAEVGSETDFVARGEDFLAFAAALAAAAAENNTESTDNLDALPLADGENAEAARRALVMKVGENITVRRLKILPAKHKLHFYVHNGRIGAMADVEGGNDSLGRDVCVHIAAMRPRALRAEDLPADFVDAERRICERHAAESGKPPEIAAKMAEGRLAKTLAECVLLQQPFLKNPQKTVGALLKGANARVEAFAALVVGGE